MNLLSHVKFTVVAAASAAATTAVNSGIIDMSGFDGVIFLAIVDSDTTGSVIGLQIQQNTLNQTGGMANITPAVTPPYTGLGTESGVGFAVDVFRPQQRYLRAVLTRTTQNAVLDAIIAIQYCADHKPTVQDVTSILESVVAVPTA